MAPRPRHVAAHFRPRRLWLYGVGNGKSGTTSLARMFGNYRSGHEVDAEHMRVLAAETFRGELDVDSARVRRVLRYRNWRHHLEVDVAGNLSPFVGPATQLFPDSRVVLLVRDCFSWLDSRVEHSLRRPQGNVTPFYLSKYALHDDPYAPEESPLRDAGLLPVASYLRAWADTNDQVLHDTPTERLLVVRTEELDGSVTELARFAGVPEESLRPVHVNQAPDRTGLLAQVPAEFVVARAREYCGPLMDRYWGSAWEALSARLPAEA